MTATANGFVGRRRIPPRRSRPSVLQRTRPQMTTNRLEQALIMAPIILLPVESALPHFAGFSLMYLMFVVQAGYVISKRPEYLSKIWNHPLLVTVYLFLGVSYLMESSHTNSDYYEIFRMLQNVFGSVFLACLCRDRSALRTVMYAYVIIGIYTSTVLFRTSYGALSTATAFDYGEADRLRAQVFEENPLEANLNALAFATAQATGVALALALTTRSSWARYLLLGSAMWCFVATFLPMSRSGVVILAGVCASVVYGYGITRFKTLAIGIVIAAAMLIWVPHAVLSRLTFSTEVDQFGRMEGRAAVYTAFFHHLPEFVLSGIGRGNFWGEWGKQSLYGNDRGQISGAHNAYFQMTIYWGLPALFALIAVLCQAYRSLPGRYGDDGLAIAVLSITVCLFVWSLTVHNLYAKEFSIGIGLLAGSQRWIWSRPNLPIGRRRSTPALIPTASSNRQEMKS